MRDAAPSNKSTWFPNSDLKDYLAVIESKHILLMADACFSGGIFKDRQEQSVRSESDDIQFLYENKSRNAMTSGDLKKVPDESIFIRYLVKSLSLNDKKYLPSRSVFNTIVNPVESNTENTPQYGSINGIGGEGGDFIFMKKDQ